MRHQQFANQNNVTGVTLPPSVRTIAYGAFQGCRYLTEVTIPPTVEEIGEQAFWACDRLQRVVISEGVQRIGERAFHRCLALTSVTIPASVRSIGARAFADCSSLTVVIRLQPASGGRAGQAFPPYALAPVADGTFPPNAQVATCPFISLPSEMVAMVPAAAVEESVRPAEGRDAPHAVQTAAAGAQAPGQQPPGAAAAGGKAAAPANAFAAPAAAAAVEVAAPPASRRSHRLANARLVLSSTYGGGGDGGGGGGRGSGTSPPLSDGSDDSSATVTIVADLPTAALTAADSAAQAAAATATATASTGAFVGETVLLYLRFPAATATALRRGFGDAGSADPAEPPQRIVDLPRDFDSSQTDQGCCTIGAAGGRLRDRVAIQSDGTALMECKMEANTGVCAACPLHPPPPPPRLSLPFPIRLSCQLPCASLLHSASIPTTLFSLTQRLLTPFAPQRPPTPAPHAPPTRTSRFWYRCRQLHA